LARFHDSCAEWYRFRGSHNKRIDTSCSSALSHDCHLGWVTAEASNVSSHPFKGKSLVQQTITSVSL
jgi:hypothetical protein